MRTGLTSVAVLGAAVLAAGCASPDYTYARESRMDRAYLGGAANVPDRQPQPECAHTRPSAVDFFGFFAAWALMFSNNVDHSAPRSYDFPDTDPSR